MINRTTIILAVLVLVAGGWIVFEGRQNTGENLETYDLPDSLTEIRISGDGGTVDLVRSESGWTVATLGRPADPNRVSVLMDNLTGEVRIATVATVRDSRSFGLDAGLIIDLVGSGASERITLGARAADGQNVYARIGDSSSIVLLPGALVTAATGTPEAFRDPVVARWPESDVLSVVLTDSSGDLVRIEHTERPGTSQDADHEGATPGDPVLASAARVERISREWHADGALREAVAPYQIENLFQELATVTAAAFPDTSGPAMQQVPGPEVRPAAVLEVRTTNDEARVLRFYPATGDLVPVELDGEVFFIQRRRALRMTMGLVSI